MYWRDLRRLIDDTKLPNALITYYRDPDINPDNMAIFDRNRPRRRGRDADLELGYAEADHWRESHICETAFFNGEIPLQGSLGYTNKDGEFVHKPYRGALPALELLIAEGCLDWRSDDLRAFFRTNDRPYPHRPGITTPAS